MQTDSTEPQGVLGRIQQHVFCLLLASLALSSGVTENLIGNLVPLLMLVLLLLSFKELDVQHFKRRAFVSFSCFIVYAFISVFWATDLDAAIERIVKLCLLLLPGVLLIGSNTLQKTPGKNLFLCLGIPYFIALAIFTLQGALQFNLIGLIKDPSAVHAVHVLELNTLAVACAVIFWSVLACIYARSYRTNIMAPIILGIVICAGQYYAITDAGWLSLCAGLFGFVLFRTTPAPIVLKTALVLSVVFILLAPPWLYHNLPIQNFQIQSDSAILQGVFEPSHIHRLEIWERCRELILQKPLFGWGITGAYHLPESTAPSIAIEGLTRSDFLYPHNLFLHVLIDFGFIGLILLMWFLFEVIDWINKQADSLRAFAGATLCSILSVYYFGFPLWRSWWIVLIVCVALIFAVLAWAQNEQANKTVQTRL